MGGRGGIGRSRRRPKKPGLNRVKWPTKRQNKVFVTDISVNDY